MRVLSRGTELEILGSSSNGNWFRVRHDNQLGWVATNRVVQVTRLGVTTTATAYFRQGPGTSFASMRSIIRGTNMLILGSSSNSAWLRVSMDNQIGWVSSNRVDNISDTGRGTHAVNAISAVTYTSVGLRRGPGNNYAVIRTIPANSTLAITRRSSSGAWLYVTFREFSPATGWREVRHTGWLHEDSVRIAPTNSGIVTTHGGRTNTSADLRSGAGNNHGIIRTLDSGASVTILRQSGDWLNVRAGSDEGWIREELANSTTEATTNIRTTLRSGPGNSYNEMSRVPAGINGTILHHQGMWVNIVIEGQTGWIPLSHAHIRPVTELANTRNSISNTTNIVNITGETGLRLVVPERRTIAAGHAFDIWQNVQVQYVATNGNVTNIAVSRNWPETFTHNGTTFTLEWEGILDNLIPGTYVRQIVIRRGNTVVGRGEQTIVTR